MKLESNQVLFRIFISLLVLFNGLLAVFSNPITDLGDAYTYLLLSKVYLGLEDINLSHRSPLFSLVMAGLMLIFKGDALFRAVLFIHYLFIALTSYNLYHFFKPLFRRALFPVIIAMMFNLSLTTIYYANILYTEIFAVFFVVLLANTLRKAFEFQLMKYYFFAGILMGLVSLVRFSVIPIALLSVLLSFYFFLITGYSWKRVFVALALLLLPFGALLHLHASYNYNKYGFYGLFPSSGIKVNRNVVVASINPDNKVSQKNQPILDIFLDARRQYDETKYPLIKGSFASLDKNNWLNDLYSGYSVYQNAKVELQGYFGFSEEVNEKLYGDSLRSFYQEIESQNQRFFWKVRLLTLLSGFRASGVSLPEEYKGINTNLLPSVMFKVFKLAVFLISFVVFCIGFYFLYFFIKNRFTAHISLVIAFAFVFITWFANTYLIVAADANRFKFPVEPFIIGLFVYYVIRLRVFALRRFKV